MVPMAGIGPATSPLPRECSTTEPHGQLAPLAQHQKSLLNKPAQQTMERETGIEPASLAWKARVLPLNYSRADHRPLRTQLCTHKVKHHSQHCSLTGGGDWIRTSVGVSQQIYSLPPLATRAPLRRISNYSTSFLQSREIHKAKPPRQVHDRKQSYTNPWCGWRGSNPRPLASEANTLSTELQPHTSD